MFDHGCTITAGIADVLGELEVSHLFMAQTRARLLAADLDKLLLLVPAMGPEGSTSCGADQLGFGRENLFRLSQQVNQLLSDLSCGRSQATVTENFRRAQQQWLDVTEVRTSTNLMDEEDMPWTQAARDRMLYEELAKER